MKFHLAEISNAHLSLKKVSRQLESSRSWTEAKSVRRAHTRQSRKSTPSWWTNWKASPSRNLPPHLSLIMRIEEPLWAASNQINPFASALRRRLKIIEILDNREAVRSSQLAASIRRRIFRHLKWKTDYIRGFVKEMIIKRWQVSRTLRAIPRTILCQILSRLSL